MSGQKRRMEKDVMDLLMSDYDVTLVDNNMQEFYVKFKGPQGTPYEGGLWKIHVELPDQYPYKSPSIGFENKIYHPNIDETSGSVCLDVINQTWSPMFGLYNIFENFIPHLLRYPNAGDPLNGEASTLLLRDANAYNDRVKEYVKRFADGSNFIKESDDKDSDEDLSSVGSFDSDEEENAEENEADGESEI